MTDYDKMSVDDLRTRYNWRIIQGTKENRLDDVDVTLMEMFAALRRAVIREASVGEVEVKIYESEDELTAPKGSPERIVTCNERFICQTWIPEGKYWLVKKEG